MSEMAGDHARKAMQSTTNSYKSLEVPSLSRPFPPHRKLFGKIYSTDSIGFKIEKTAFAKLERSTKKGKDPFLPVNIEG